MVSERAHVVLTTPPHGSANAIASGAVISLKGWAHASIIALKGTGSAQSTLTIKECTSLAGSGQTAIGFAYQQVNIGGGDVATAALTRVGSAGIAFTGSSSGFVVAEVDAAELSDGFSCMVPQLAAGQIPLACLVILTSGRYMEDITATAL